MTGFLFFNSYSCYRDRRDGLSKEGCGRVAVLKYTGLVKSYTLECNYNTGCIVNIIPPTQRPLGKHLVQPLLVPPKYTPQIYEEVWYTREDLLIITSLFARFPTIRDYFFSNLLPQQILPSECKFLFNFFSEFFPSHLAKAISLISSFSDRWFCLVVS